MNTKRLAAGLLVDSHPSAFARSGPSGLGLWTDESKLILADHLRHVGGEAPQRVVGV